MMNILEIGRRRFTSNHFSSYDNSSDSWEVKMLAWGENISDILLSMKEVSAEMYNVITNAVYNCGGIAEYLSLNLPSSREYLCGSWLFTSDTYRRMRELPCSFRRS